MPDNLFTVKQASAITGVSRQSIRAYTSNYARWFSTEATPSHGGERKFTRDDLKLIAFIAGSTAAHSSHEQVQEQLARGDMDLFRWEPPELPNSPSEPLQDSNTSLVPVERLQAAQALMMDAQRREQEAIEHNRILQETVNQTQRELGKLEGELAASKATLAEIAALRAELHTMQQRPRSWWARLWGGGD